MQPYNPSLFQHEADALKALAHPLRLWILQQLSDGAEHCVCEFVNASKPTFATISGHLNILKKAALIIDEKRGKQIFYRLAAPCLTLTLSSLLNRPQ